MYSGSPPPNVQVKASNFDLRQVAVDLLGRIRVVGTFEVLAGDEVFDALLDHGDIGLEATGQDGYHLRYELIVRKLSAGPIVVC